MNFIDTQQVITKLQKARRIAITAHISPDGDAIGSVIGLREFLRAIGKEAAIILHDTVPTYLSYLDPAGSIISLDEKSAESEVADKFVMQADLFIICDLNDIKRTGMVAQLLNTNNIESLVIDHHQDPKEFAHSYFINTDASSTCQLVCEIIFNYFDGEIPVSREAKERIATSLYTGIYTDSGGFSFPRTTKDLLLKAAELIEWGADPVDIAKRINSSKKLSALKLSGRAIDKMNIIADGHAAIITLAPRDFVETSATIEDKEGIVNEPLKIEQVQVTALITQTSENGEIKVSFRSKSPHVNLIASKYGGGGHIYAAATKFQNRELSEVENIIVEEFEMIFKH